MGILVLSLILGIGLSWSILRQRLSGQASVDEIEGCPCPSGLHCRAHAPR